MSAAEFLAPSPLRCWTDGTSIMFPAGDPNLPASTLSVHFSVTANRGEGISPPSAVGGKLPLVPILPSDSAFVPNGVYLGIQPQTTFSVQFSGGAPHLIRIFAATWNVLTAGYIAPGQVQDYMVAPPQSRIDGFQATTNLANQFTAVAEGNYGVRLSLPGPNVGMPNTSRTMRIEVTPIPTNLVGSFNQINGHLMGRFAPAPGVAIEQNIFPDGSPGRWRSAQTMIVDVLFINPQEFYARAAALGQNQINRIAIERI